MGDIKTIFEKYVSEEVLTEDVKEELSIVVEALVMEKAEEKFNIARENLIAEYDERLKLAVEEQVAEEQKNLDSYMTYVAEEFINENKVKIENAIVVEKATKIIDGIQKVFEANGISLADSDENIVEETNKRYENMAERYNEISEKVMEMKSDMCEMEKALTFAQETKGLTAMEQERVLNLMSGLVVESVDDFQNKLKSVIKNLRFATTEDNQSDVDDVVIEDNETDTHSEDVTKYLKKIKRNL